MQPLTDIFWLGNDDKQIKVVLPDNWEGLCAPVMITEHMIVVSACPVLDRNTRKTEK